MNWIWYIPIGYALIVAIIVIFVHYNVKKRMREHKNNKE